MANIDGIIIFTNTVDLVYIENMNERELALITGASSGIGWEFASILAAKNTDLVLTSRSTTKLINLKTTLESEYDIKVWIYPKDLSIPDASLEIHDYLKENNLKPTILINNAGFGDYGLFHQADWEKTEMMINLNILSLTHLTRLIGEDMVQRNSGRILNVASTAAFQPGPLMSVYYATKAYVLSFSEGIANEWKDFGVTVTALCPGATVSNFAEAAEATESKIFKNKKLPTSREVAEHGIKAMFKGEVVSIHGFINAALVTSVRFTPRSIIRKIVRNIQERNKP
jgi:short-subunit dehydrogenase